MLFKHIYSATKVVDLIVEDCLVMFCILKSNIGSSYIKLAVTLCSALFLSKIYRSNLALIFSTPFPIKEGKFNLSNISSENSISVLFILVLKAVCFSRYGK